MALVQLEQEDLELLVNMLGWELEQVDEALDIVTEEGGSVTEMLHGSWPIVDLKAAMIALQGKFESARKDDLDVSAL